jgi:hypothetical protein
MYGQTEYVEVGLMPYGPHIPDQNRRAATYVADARLRGRSVPPTGRSEDPRCRGRPADYAPGKTGGCDPPGGLISADTRPVTSAKLAGRVIAR